MAQTEFERGFVAGVWATKEALMKAMLEKTVLIPTQQEKEK